jgi:hypothetical protein
MNDRLNDSRFTDGRPTRSLLLSLLTEACELEHGLACCYLFAAFSLKKELSEPGMTWEHQRRTRMWAAQIFMVAAQEMQHLAEAWNLLTAMGGTAYYGRPAFPQPSKYYALRKDHSPQLELTAFSRQTLDRFVLFEEPDSRAAERQSPLGFDTIGGLYRRVEVLIDELDEKTLFVGNSAAQVGPGMADFPGLEAITDRVSAKQAIERIIAQGEGTRSDSKDSHWGVFQTIREQLDEASASWGEFDPARPVVSNPVAPRRADQAPGANPIKNEETGRVAELFDSAYSLMLQLVLAAFSPTLDHEVRQRMAHVGIGLMPTVVRPLAETLTQLPFDKSPATTAGAGFFVSRFLPLAGSDRIALAVARERLHELAHASGVLKLAHIGIAPDELVTRFSEWANRL